MTGERFQVVIRMSESTVTRLARTGFSLYAFRAVQDTGKSSRPLIWFRTRGYSTTTPVSWTNQYHAYTSSGPITRGGCVTPGFSVDLAPGQTLRVRAGRIGDVLWEGPPTGLSLLNTTAERFTCGLSQVMEGTARPFWACPLDGNHLATVAPLDKVLLLFSTLDLAPGTIVEHFHDAGAPAGVWGPGVRIDLTQGREREVGYDLDRGWDWGGFTWAQQVAPNANLVPWLIEPPAAPS